MGRNEKDPLHSAFFCGSALVEDTRTPNVFSYSSTTAPGLQGEKQRLIWAYKILFLDVPLLLMPCSWQETIGCLTGFGRYCCYHQTWGWRLIHISGSKRDLLMISSSCFWCLWSWFWSMFFVPCCWGGLKRWVLDQPGALSTRRAQDHFHRCGSGA